MAQPVFYQIPAPINNVFNLDNHIRRRDYNPPLNIIDTIDKLTNQSTRLYDDELNDYSKFIWDHRNTLNEDKIKYNSVQGYENYLRDKIIVFINDVIRNRNNYNNNPYNIQKRIPQFQLTETMKQLLRDIGASYMFSMRDQPPGPFTPDKKDYPIRTYTGTTSVNTTNDSKRPTSHEEVQSKRSRYSGGTKTIKYKGRSYKVHVGSRGGHYILVQQQKIYV